MLMRFKKYDMSYVLFIRQMITGTYLKIKNKIKSRSIQIWILILILHHADD